MPADRPDPRGTASMSARMRDMKMPALPAPGPELTLRPHTTGSFVIEVVAAAVGLFICVDAAASGYWGVAAIGLVAAVIVGGGGLLARRRSTWANPDGVRVRGAVRERTFAWDEIEGFELLDRGRLLRPQIVLVTTDGARVYLPHQDAKSLAIRPEISKQFFLGLIDRLETVRRTAGHRAPGPSPD